MALVVGTDVPGQVREAFEANSSGTQGFWLRFFVFSAVSSVWATPRYEKQRYCVITIWYKVTHLLIHSANIF